jgi:tetratricopeptide (TPR) repeat protein
MGVETDPISAYAQTILSNVAALAGSLDEALTAGFRGVEFDPESFSAWYFLGYVHHLLGNIPAAIEAYKKAIDISGRHNWALASLLSILIEPSEYQNQVEAGYIYKELLTKEKVGYVSPFILAVTSAASGNNDESIRYTKLALDRHDPYFTILVPGRPDNKTFLAIPEIRNMIRSIGLKI